MESPAPRRRFQFRLRTLMIGVTLLAAISAAVVWVVRDRERLTQEQERLIQERDDALDRLNGPGVSLSIRKRADTGQLEIEIPAGTPPKDIAKVRRLYPDAKIKLIPAPATKP
jgi:hypothetical protein